MIRLTAANGKQKWFNPDLITEIGPGVDETFVWTGDKSVTVQESPSEVVRKVLEYKLAMERYRTGYAEALQHHGDPQWIFENAELKLSTLAGLEDANDD